MSALVDGAVVGLATVHEAVGEAGVHPVTLRVDPAGSAAGSAPGCSSTRPGWPTDAAPTRCS